MDDYQIPTIDGRYATLRYDEQSGTAVLHLPPPENEGEVTACGFTPEDAERLAAGLTAIRSRMSDDSPDAMGTD
ncbi:MAG TPA: hypothetical protein VGJ13_01685 [Pseudonocardiaceae bacterium]